MGLKEQFKAVSALANISEIARSTGVYDDVFPEGMSEDLIEVTDSLQASVQDALEGDDDAFVEFLKEIVAELHAEVTKEGAE